MRYIPIFSTLVLCFIAGCASSGNQTIVQQRVSLPPDSEQPSESHPASAGTEKPTVLLAAFQDPALETPEPVTSRDDDHPNDETGDQKAESENPGLPQHDATNAFSAIQFSGSVGGAETLHDAWETAVAASHKLQSKRNETGAADYAHAAALSARMPTVRTINGYTALDKTPGVSVNLPGISALPFGSLPLGEQNFFSSATLATLPLYTHGRIDSAINATSSNVQASRFDEYSEAQNLKMEVAEIYVSVLKTQRLVEVADSAVETLAAHLKDVQDLFDKGVVAKSDVLAVQTAHANAQENQLKTTNGLNLASAAYNRLMDRQLDAPVMVAEIANGSHMTDGRIEELIGQAMAQRSELQSVSHKSWALRHQADYEASGTGPQVGLVGGFHYLENDNLTNEDIWSLTLAAEWKIFDGGISRNKAAALEQRSSAVARLQKDLQSNITLQVRQAWLNLDNANERITVAQTSVDHATESLRVSLDRYRKEVGTNTEVLDAQTLLTHSRGNYYAAIYDAALARLMLDRAVGNL